MAEEQKQVIVEQEIKNAWPAMVTKTSLLIVFAVLAIVFFYIEEKGGGGLGQVSATWSVAAFLCSTFICAAAYELVALVINITIRRRRGSIGEVKMLTTFARIMAAIVIVALLLSATGALARWIAVVSAFAGMLLGWSLQAPVSGIAAWILVTIKRPFRIGDRVLFPSLGLAGDVLEVGLMYTKLDQVGGSIGSEDAIGRNILIPNAMLFSQVAINYTPRQDSAYFLDEVVTRITYDSDWDTAEKIMVNAARKVTANIIKETGKEPYVRADMYDYGVYMRLRYMTLAMDRPRISHEILSIVFKEFQHHPRVDFAIPFVYSYKKGVERSAGGAQAAESPVDLPLVDIVDPQARTPLSPEEEKGVIDLAARLKTSYLIQPIVVHPAGNGKYQLISGRFRYLACRNLGWVLIPALVRTGSGTGSAISA
ncbi:MAG: mechanosensitive ion channel domain-containing protein [bacterium]